MAATLSAFRLLNSRFSASFLPLKKGLLSGNTVSPWSRMSLQCTKQAKLLNTYSRQPWIKHYGLLCGQTQKTASHTRAMLLTARTSSANVSKPLLFVSCGNLYFRRGVTLVSKKGKRKTCKAVAKRFIRTGKGKLKRWRCGYHHNQTKKSGRRKRFLRKPTYASKTQLKTLNKMLNGW